MASETRADREEIQQLGHRLGMLEGRFASSWAAHTRDEYEQGFRKDCKHDLLRFATGLVVSSIVVIGGGAYLYINAAVSTAYHTELTNATKKIEDTFEKFKTDQKRYSEWQ